VRLDDEHGRPLTQLCARAVYDAVRQPAGIHYRSKHDDAEDCWALFDRARVAFTHTVDLDPRPSNPGSSGGGQRRRQAVENAAPV
jgi:RES domain